MGDTLEEQQVLKGHKDRVWGVAWSPSGHALASCGGDKAVRIWQKENEEYVCKAVLEGAHSRTVRSVAWSPCGTMLASACFDGTAAIWKGKDGEFTCVATLEGHENEVKSVSWSKSGTMLATCSRDKSVWIWENEGEEDEWECLSVLHGHSQDVKCVKWHPDDEYLVSGSYDNSLKVWTEQEDDWYCTETAEAHTSTIWGICFKPAGKQAGKLLASCSDDENIIIWERKEVGEKEKWDNVCTLTGYHSRCIFSVDWSSQGVLASAGADDTICLFRESPESPNLEGKRVFVRCSTKERAHSTDINCISWHPSGGMLASACDDGTIKIWKFAPFAEY